MHIPRHFTGEHAQTLRAQAFDDLSPGPVFARLPVLLDFLGTAGVKARESTISCRSTPFPSWMNGWRIRCDWR